jgi:ribonuclease D
MSYLNRPADIRAAIVRLAQQNCLWLDTEVADCFTPQPQLSLIQAAIGSEAWVLDVLDQPELVQEFVAAIMVNPAIKKIFHQASFDLRFLGGAMAANVTCTLKLAKKIPVNLLPVTNHQLKTLVSHFIPGADLDKSEQLSDWRLRPLRDTQIHYAAQDVVYLEQVHRGLLALATPVTTPQEVDIAALSREYSLLEQQLKPLIQERDRLKALLQEALLAQAQTETTEYRLQTQARSTKKCSLKELAAVAQSNGWDFQIAVSKELQTQLGKAINQLSMQVETTQSVSLKLK